MSAPPTTADLLRGAFRAAVEAAQPEAGVARFLPGPPTGRTVVVGAGKAAARMAAEVERLWTQRHPDAALSGVVIAPYGHGADGASGRITVLEAAHPVPDAAGEAATRAVLDAVRGLGPTDLVVCLLSGGGSALLTAPHGVTLAQKADLTAALLASGAGITQINAVRKHLSRIKGGQLARACAPAPVVTLVVSDVVGDDLSVIASGPTAPDRSTFTEALVILDRYGIPAPEARRHLLAGAGGALPETPKPNDEVFGGVRHHLVVTNAVALGAASAALAAGGVTARVVSDAIEGPARRAATAHARLARSLGPREALVSGGETTTVVAPNAGRGGRNLEFLLALALELRGEAGVYALAADSDGIDGTSFAAGAVVTPDTLARAEALGLDARRCLDGADAHGFFEALGDLVVTGPTGTNVNDIRIVLRV